MLARAIPAAIAATVALAFAAAPAAAQTLDKIKQRGVLVVGSKADYKPFGFRDPSGAIVGFEPDLGRDIAERLGVKLELEPVVSSNRMQFLQQGKIDLMIATMNDKPDRRQLVGIIEPLYYASGVNVLANKKANLKTWEQLKNVKPSDFGPYASDVIFPESFSPTDRDGISSARSSRRTSTPRRG